MSLNRGYSLLEILVALAVLGLATAVLTIPLKGMRERQQLSAFIADLRSCLGDARARAMQTFSVSAVTFSPQDRSVSGCSNGDIRLPGNIEIWVKAAREVRREAGASMLFFPDGSSSGGGVAIRAGSSAHDLRVSWITGAVLASP